MDDHGVAYVALDTSKLAAKRGGDRGSGTGRRDPLSRRIVAPPAFSEVHDAIRQALLREAVQLTIGEARAQLTIRKLKIDGTPLGAMPDITPTLPPVKPQDSPPKT